MYYYTAMCSVIRVTLLLYVSNAYIGLMVIPWHVFGGGVTHFEPEPVYRSFSDLSWLTLKKLLPSVLNSLSRHYVISAFEIESLNKSFILG